MVITIWVIAAGIFGLWYIANRARSRRGHPIGAFRQRAEPDSPPLFFGGSHGGAHDRPDDSDSGGSDSTDAGGGDAGGGDGGGGDGGGGGE